MSFGSLHKRYSRYHYCVVRECKNTSINSPAKLWIREPSEISRRNNWLRIAKRDPDSLSTKNRLYYCEDHFNLENDMANYMEYKIMGKVKTVRMKPNCVPSRFDCQTNCILKQVKHVDHTYSKKARKTKYNKMENSTPECQQEEMVHVKLEVQEHDGVGQDYDEEKDVRVHIKEEVETAYETQDWCLEDVRCKVELGPEVLQPRDQVFVPQDSMNDASIDIVKQETLDTTINHTSYSDIRSLPSTREVYNRLSSKKILLDKQKRTQSEKIFTCSMCYGQYSNEKAFKKHLKSHMVYTCEICNKQFPTRPELHKHKLSHESHACKICNRLFSQKRYLVTHIQITHAKNIQRYICDICQKQYYTGYGLATHMEVHLSVNFTCQYCKKQFNNKTSLLQHETEHKDDKLYSCEVCMKQFKQMGRLNSHLSSSHTNVRGYLYVCAMCPRHFLYKHNLETHIRSTHKDDFI